MPRKWVPAGYIWVMDKRGRLRRRMHRFPIEDVRRSRMELERMRGSKHGRQRTQQREQNGNLRTQQQEERDTIQDSLLDSNSSGATGVSSHKKKKVSEAEGWQDLRSGLGRGQQKKKKKENHVPSSPKCVTTGEDSVTSQWSLPGKDNKGESV